MKLTEDQLVIRDIFRRTIVNGWNTKKTMMFGTVENVQVYLGLSYDETKEAMAAIPSIGRFRDMMPIHAYVARHFRPVSDALYDGCSPDKALKIWSTTKRVNEGKKRTDEEMRVYEKTRRDYNKLGAIAELHRNRPDRYDKTSWNKCK